MMERDLTGIGEREWPVQERVTLEGLADGRYWRTDPRPADAEPAADDPDTASG